MGGGMGGSMDSGGGDIDMGAAAVPVQDTLEVEKAKQKEPERTCGGCRKPVTTDKKCGVCKKVYYCSKDCQIAHWKAGHKTVCGKKHKKQWEKFGNSLA